MTSNYNDVEKNRRRAAQCITLAQTAFDSSAKLKLLDMARSWLLLVEQAAKNRDTILIYETPPRSVA